jgi:hypothetical protein
VSPRLTSPGRGARSIAASAAAGALVVFVACAFALLLVEAAFRLAPRALLPAGVYGAGVRHPQLGMNVHGRRVLYNKETFIERVPNHEGFMDVDHAPAKEEGIVRVGFFGDSYVESVQVPQESVFFRRLALMRPGRIEPLAFGISGWGTLQAERAFETFAPRYSLDIAVYLFVENDPGNNSLEVSRFGGDVDSGMPFAALRGDGDGYDIRWITEPGHEGWWYGAGKWLQRHSLLAHVVRDRVAKLRAYGVRAGTSAEATQMAGRATGMPTVNDLPSTWPPELRARTETLTELILRDWRDSADRRGSAFLVLYVPRGEDQLSGKLAVEDTWLPWLRDVCRRLGVPLIDPSEPLLRSMDGGGHVYGDHWSPQGHEVIARLLDEALAPLVVDAPAPGPAEPAARAKQRPR